MRAVISWRPAFERGNMKKILAFGLVICSAVSSFAALDAFDSMTVKTLTAPIGVNAAIRTNTAVDIAAAKGIGHLLIMQGPAYTNTVTCTNTVTIQKSANGSTGWTAVTSAVYVANMQTGTVSSIKLDINTLQRYLRAIVSSVEDTSGAGVVLIYPK